jgi:hypothetical protein
MKMRGGFEQCHNAQAAVEVSSMLIVGEHVTDQANDKQQLVGGIFLSVKSLEFQRAG